MSENEGIARLFEAANKLRGSVESAEYKHLSTRRERTLRSRMRLAGETRNAEIPPP